MRKQSKGKGVRILVSVLIGLALLAPINGLAASEGNEGIDVTPHTPMAISMSSGEATYHEPRVYVTGEEGSGGGSFNGPDVVFSEGFENLWVPDSDGDLAPPGWEYIRNVPPEYSYNYYGYPTFWYQEGFYVESGSYAAAISFIYPWPWTQDEWLITPEIDLTSYVMPTLTFWADYCGQDLYPPVEHHYIMVSTDGGATWTTVEDLGWPGSAYEEHNWFDYPVVIDLSDFQLQTIKIAFRLKFLDYEGGSYYTEWYLDNITLTATEVKHYDVGVTSIDYPVPGEIYPAAPLKVKATIKNFGIEPMEGVDVHLQIYQEVPYDPEVAWYDDMESCCHNWTAYDWNDDGCTWTWTDRRYNSPTHSWRSTCCDRAVYTGNSFDSLISDEIVVPDCAVYAWLNFSHWLQAETTYWEAVDYGILSISINGGPWQLVEVFYGDPAWTYPEQTVGKMGYAVYDPGFGISLHDMFGVKGGDRIRINFTFVSDPCHNYEGWYIDDVKILYQCGPIQPLIYSGYKYLSGILMPGEERHIEFPLEWTGAQDDTVYYIQVYTADERDENPLNDEINQSYYFGVIHDGEVVLITAPDEVRLSDCEESVDVPISVVVCNNGNVAENIPVKIEARLKIEKELFYDDFESPDSANNWALAYSADNEADLLGHIDDWDAYSGDYAMWITDPYTHFYQNNMAQAVIINSEAIGLTLPPDAVRIWFKFCAKWAFENEGHSSFEYGDPPIYYVDYDAWAPILEDPEANAFLAWWPSTELAYKVTYHNDNKWNCPENPGTWKNPYDLISPSLFEIDVMPWIKHYQELGYVQPGHLFSLGWFVRTDESDVYEDDVPIPFGGLGLDDVQVVAEIPGPVVWSTIQTVHLQPGECTTINVKWPADDYSFYIISAETMVKDDIDPDNDKKVTETYIYEQCVYDDIERSEKRWSTEDNTYGHPANWTICSDDSCDWRENHYWWNGFWSSSAHVPVNDVLMIGPFDFTPYAKITFEYDTFYDLELGYDYGYVEISNDSQNWWLLDYFTGYSDWTHKTYTLFDVVGGVALQDYFGNPIGLTDTLYIRFRYATDEVFEMKGWYIDNVQIMADDFNILFFDDMESGTGSWVTMVKPTGDLWHRTTYDAYSGDYSWWCGWEHTYSTYDFDAITGYSHSPMQYYNNMDDKLILTLDLSNKYQAYMYYMEKYDFADINDYGIVELSTDGTTWKPIMKTAGLSTDWTLRRIDLTRYLPGTVYVRFRFISNETGTATGWFIDDINITCKVDATAPVTTCILNPPSPDGCNGWYVSPVEVTLEAVDDKEVAAIYYSIDGGPEKVYTAPFTINVDGEHTIAYYAVDHVGNTEPTKTVSFKIDSTAPTATITYPQSGYIYLFGRELFANPLGGTLIIGGIKFQASASDTGGSELDYVAFDIDGYSYEKAAPGPYEVWWHKFDLLPASYTLKVYAYDYACNKGTESTLTFTHWL